MLMDLQKYQSADQYNQQDDDKDDGLNGAAGEQPVFAAVILDARPDWHVAAGPV